MNALAYATKTQAAPRLKIGKPDDTFEREADRAADEVMRGTGPAAQWSFSRVSIAPPLQRKCSCGGGEKECEECKAKATVQRKATGAAEMENAPVLVQETLRSPGTPLDHATRRFMEIRFGHDFGNVRIHSDARAAASARAVGALAYTVDNRIAFDGASYAPQTQEGRRLLAHELAHVVQQGGAQPLLHAGSRTVQGGQGAAMVHAGSARRLQRQTGKTGSGTGSGAGSASDHDTQTAPPATSAQAKCEEFPGGATDCDIDEQSGIPTGKVTPHVEETNPCTRPCVEAHENVHVKQLRTYCPTLRDCYRAADAGKRPALDCFKMAASGIQERECAAYNVSVPCIENRLRTAKECQSKENKAYGKRKLASDKCFRDKNCNAVAKPEAKKRSK